MQRNQKQVYLKNIIDCAVPVIHLECIKFFSVNTINVYGKVLCKNVFRPTPGQQHAYAFRQWFIEYWTAEQTYNISVELF